MLVHFSSFIHNKNNSRGIKRSESERELTRETNSCSKSSEGGMSSNASRIPSLQMNKNVIRVRRFQRENPSS